VPVLQHSSSTVTLLEGLKYESNSATVTPNRETKDNYMDRGALSDIGYVNDGLHPLSYSLKGDFQQEGVATNFSTESGKQLQQASSDDVFLPSTAKKLANCYVRSDGKDKAEDGTGKMSQQAEVGCSNGCNSSSQQQLDAKSQNCSSPPTSRREEQTYIDYDKLLQMSSLYSSGKEGSRREQCKVIEGLQKANTSVTCSVKNSYLDSNDVTVLLMDNPFRDDSGFKSHGDTISMVSI